MKRTKKLLLALVLILAVGLLAYSIATHFMARPAKVLTEEERRQLALSIAKSYKLYRDITGAEVTLGEEAQRSEREGFSITWYVRHVDGNWYKVWYRGVSPDGRACGSAYFYVNIVTREVFVERVAEIGV